MQCHLDLHKFLSKKIILDDENSNHYDTAMKFYEQNIQSDTVIRYNKIRNFLISDIELQYNNDKRSIDNPTHNIGEIVEGIQKVLTERSEQYANNITEYDKIIKYKEEMTEQQAKIEMETETEKYKNSYYDIEINGGDIIDSIHFESDTLDRNYIISYHIGENTYMSGNINVFIPIALQNDTIKLRVTFINPPEPTDTFIIKSRCYLLNDEDKKIFTTNIINVQNTIYKHGVCNCKSKTLF
jgi:hypothetical protein